MGTWRRMPASASTVLWSSESVNVAPISSKTTGRYLILPRKRPIAVARCAGGRGPSVRRALRSLAPPGVGSIRRGIRSVRARLRCSTARRRARMRRARERRGRHPPARRSSTGATAARSRGRGSRAARRARLPTGKNGTSRPGAAQRAARHVVDAGEREITDAHKTWTAASPRADRGGDRRTYRAARDTLAQPGLVAENASRGELERAIARRCECAARQARRTSHGPNVSTCGVSSRTPTMPRRSLSRAGVSSAIPACFGREILLPAGTISLWGREEVVDADPRRKRSHHPRLR